MKMESWLGGVLNQNAYYSKTFEEDLAYDHSTREEFIKEINERESKKINELVEKKSRLKNFFHDVINKENSVTAQMKNLAAESVFQPGRNYWSSYRDYITYSLCPFVMQFEIYALMKHLLSEGSGYLCVTAFILTKMFVNSVMTYIIISLGAYHKQGIFHLRYLLPIAKYFPYISSGMLVWSMSSRIDLFSEILLYFILYFLAEIYIIDLKFTGCKEVLPYPVGVECYSPVEKFQREFQNCSLVEMQEFIFKCPDNKKYLIPEQSILQYMHYNAQYMFYRNLSMVMLFFILLFTSGRVHKLLKFFRLAMFIRLFLYIFMIILSSDILTSGLLAKLHTDGNWTIATLFKPGTQGPKDDLFMGCMAAIRDLPDLLCVQWGGTSRISGSTKPVRDSVLITLLDIFISSVEMLLFLMVYFKAMEEMMLWIGPILGFRTRRIPLVPIYIFARVYSNNAEISMIVILFIFVITHLNSLICEFESLKFSISLINQETYVNSNLISFGLIPVFYTFSLLCEIIESTINAPHPVSLMISTAFSTTSMAIFLVLFFIYSYTRFSLDVEFMTGNRPSILLKFLLAGPIIFLIGIIVLITYLWTPTVDFYLYVLTSLMFLIFGMLYVVYQYASNTPKNFKNKFVPSFFYGPPNHELRKERKRYFHTTN